MILTIILYIYLFIYLLIGVSNFKSYNKEHIFLVQFRASFSIID